MNMRGISRTKDRRLTIVENGLTILYSAVIYYQQEEALLTCASLPT
uniref:Uncharacterized protein n=1 Tax=Anopheles arabiensis TaxID=7173 RepID=A0A182IGL3_ANOAR